MELFDHDYRAHGADRMFAGRASDLPSGRARARDASRLDRLYRLKLAGRDPERMKRRRRASRGLLGWIALALLTAAALASPVRGAGREVAGATPLAAASPHG